MKYIKYILILIALFLTFWWGVITWYLIPQYWNIDELEKWVPSQIRVCNETDIDFTDISTNWEYFSDVKKWSCTEYKNTTDLYPYTTIDIYTKSNEGHKDHYSKPTIDIMGVSRIILWKHTIYIRGLEKTGDKIIQYKGWIEYEIE